MAVFLLPTSVEYHFGCEVPGKVQIAHDGIVVLSGHAWEVVHKGYSHLPFCTHSSPKNLRHHEGLSKGSCGTGGAWVLCGSSAAISGAPLGSEEASSIRRSSSRSSSACSLRTRSVASSSSSEDWACSVNSNRTRYSAALAASSASRLASSRIGLPRLSAAISAPSPNARSPRGPSPADCRVALNAWR